MIVGDRIGAVAERVDIRLIRRGADHVRRRFLRRDSESAKGRARPGRSVGEGDVLHAELVVAFKLADQADRVGADCQQRVHSVTGDGDVRGQCIRQLQRVRAAPVIVILDGVGTVALKMDIGLVPCVAGDQPGRLGRSLNAMIKLEPPPKNAVGKLYGFKPVGGIAVELALQRDRLAIRQVQDHVRAGTGGGNADRALIGQNQAVGAARISDGVGTIAKGVRIRLRPSRALGSTGEFRVRNNAGEKRPALPLRAIGEADISHAPVVVRDLIDQADLFAIIQVENKIVPFAGDDDFVGERIPQDQAIFRRILLIIPDRIRPVAFVVVVSLKLNRAVDRVGPGLQLLRHQRVVDRSALPLCAVSEANVAHAPVVVQALIDQADFFAVVDPDDVIITVANPGDLGQQRIPQDQAIFP